jgi:hypothetical protein
VVSYSRRVGRANAQLLKRWEKAKRSGDYVLMAATELKIDRSQAECRHPLEERTAGLYEGKYLVWCTLCAKVLVSR